MPAKNKFKKIWQNRKKQNGEQLASKFSQLPHFRQLSFISNLTLSSYRGFFYLTLSGDARNYGGLMFLYTGRGGIAFFLNTEI